MTDSPRICPFCHEPVEGGIIRQGEMWHEDCAAQAIVQEAETQAILANPYREPEVLLRSQQAFKSNGCLLGGLTFLFDLGFPIIVGSLLGGVVGTVIALLFQRAVTDVLYSLVAGTFTGSLLMFLLAWRGVFLKWTAPALDGIIKRDKGQ